MNPDSATEEGGKAASASQSNVMSRLYTAPEPSKSRSTSRKRKKRKNRRPGASGADDSDGIDSEAEEEAEEQRQQMQSWLMTHVETPEQRRKMVKQFQDWSSKKNKKKI